MTTTATTAIPGPTDQLLAEAAVLLVVGPGGVGKTTLSAALAARAAATHGRRALVVTVDPARRLAGALGLDGLVDEAVLVPVGGGSGRFWAQMVDMERSWDRLVERHAPDAETAEALLSNRLYRALTRRFVQSHDYIALDRLVDLVDNDRYDLVVIDTPPSVHVLDVLDAPDRMLEFFDSRLLRWLTAPYRNRLVTAAAKPFMAVAERLLGGPFLAQIAEFFWLFSSLQPDFVVRANTVKARLADPATRFVLVHTAEESTTEQATELADELASRRHELSLRLVNRVLDPALCEIGAEEVAAIRDDAARSAVASLIAEAEQQAGLINPNGRAAARRALRLRRAPTELIPWGGLPIGDVERLISLLDGLPGPPGPPDG